MSRIGKEKERDFVVFVFCKGRVIKENIVSFVIFVLVISFLRFFVYLVFVLF